MHTYRKDGDKWRVGYYTMEVNYNIAGGGAGGMWSATVHPPPIVSTWQFLSEHDSEETAMDRVNYLNGGSIAI